MSVRTSMPASSLSTQTEFCSSSLSLRTYSFICSPTLIRNLITSRPTQKKQTPHVQIQSNRRSSCHFFETPAEVNFVPALLWDSALFLPALAAKLLAEMMKKSPSEHFHDVNSLRYRVMCIFTRV